MTLTEICFEDYIILCLDFYIQGSLTELSMTRSGCQVEFVFDCSRFARTNVYYGICGGGFRFDGMRMRCAFARMAA